MRRSHEAARTPAVVSSNHPRLTDVMRECLRLRRASDRTADAYVEWVRRFVRFHRVRHSREMGETEVSQLLSHVATECQVATSTPNQALTALLFSYAEVFETPFGRLSDLVRAKKPRRQPTVMTRDEAVHVLRALSGAPRLIALLMYESGLRLMEARGLRVKDIDFGGRAVVVRHGKGGRGRLTMLADSVAGELAPHLAAVQALSPADLIRLEKRPTSLPIDPQPAQGDTQTAPVGMSHGRVVDGRVLKAPWRHELRKRR